MAGRDPRQNPRAGQETLAAAPLLNLQAMAADLALVAPQEKPRRLSKQTAAPPLTALHRPNTSRLLPTRYSDSVLTRIADSDEDLQMLYALDGATNDRLLAEANNRLGMPAAELVSGLPYARIVNAAFTHPHPLGARFSTPERGAWYAAFELPTAKAEVLFHRSVQFAEIGWQQPEVLDYDHYYADFSGLFHDLREPGQPSVMPQRPSLEQPPHEQPPRDRSSQEQPLFDEAGQFPSARRAACLSPDSYLASQQLAVELLAAGSPGIVYPSTRRASGTCLACFRPAIVANVRKRDLHRLTWRPDGPATFTRISRTSAGAPALVAEEPLPGQT